MSHKPGVRTIFAVSLLVMAAVTVTQLARGQGQSPKNLGFKKQFTIEIKNPRPMTLENEPVILSVEEIRAVAPDFNTYNYSIFEQTGQDYRLIISQADDLNKDRYHDEIVFIKTLPPSSTTKLACYYSPKGSFQLMTTPKAHARAIGAPANAAVGWESNLCAFRFLNGQIEAYGKLYAGLVLRKLTADDGKPQEWGMRLHDAGDSAGLGGLSLWDGKTRIPLADPGGRTGLQIQRTVLAQGPIRGLVKIEYSNIHTDKNDYGVVMLLSAFADNAFSRQDIILHSKSGPGGPVMAGLGIQKLTGESYAFDKAKGYAATWGRGSESAGEVGLAIVFNPSDFAGTEDGSVDRFIKLNAKAGKRQTYWVIGGWEKGIISAESPAAKNWPLKVEELSARLRVPVEIRYKTS